MNDLHLSSDDRRPVQSHLDEFTRRLTTVIILVIILTGIWSLSIDELLHYTMLQLDPCADACINIFSPDEWAGTRWLSATLLGLLTAAPFAMVQAYSFARSGLLPSERRAFVVWMVVMGGLAFGSLVFTTTIFLPWLYSYGHSFNDVNGLVGRYDAAEILRISISISWAIILVLAAMSVVMIAGMSKLLWEGNASWWRLRIHGMMLMLLWLVIPSGLPGLLVALTCFASGLVELVGWRYFRASMPVAHGLLDLLDEDGGTHRVLYVDCSCFGTSPRIEPLKGMGMVSYKSICRSPIEQDHLLDVTNRFQATKLVFSGCMIDSFPASYIDSLRFLGCETESLDIAHLSAARTDNETVDLTLAMSSLVEPWSEKIMVARSLLIIENSDVTEIIYGEEIPFGLNLQPKQAWITSPKDSLLAEIKKLGILLTHNSN